MTYVRCLFVYLWVLCYLHGRMNESTLLLLCFALLACLPIVQAKHIVWQNCVLRAIIANSILLFLSQNVFYITPTLSIFKCFVCVRVCMWIFKLIKIQNRMKLKLISYFSRTASSILYSEPRRESLWESHQKLFKWIISYIMHF